MDNQVQFEGEQLSRDFYKTKDNMPKLNKLVIKMGLAKDQAGSNKMLIVIAIISILLAVGVYVYYVVGINPFAAVGNIKKPKELPPEVQRAIVQQQTEYNQ